MVVIDKRVKKCSKLRGLDTITCYKLVNALDNLGNENDRIWSTADVIKGISNDLYTKLDRAYTTVRDAQDRLRDIVGDVD